MKVDEFLKATGRNDSAPVTFADLRALEDPSPAPSPKEDAPAADPTAPAAPQGDGATS